MAVSNLKEVYIDEMRDLWSANEQMQKFMTSLSAKASDQKLKDMLEGSTTGIGKHTETLKSLLDATGAKVGAEHCKGMQGLIAEAKKHALDEDIEPDLRLMIRRHHAARRRQRFVIAHQTGAGRIHSHRCRENGGQLAAERRQALAAMRMHHVGQHDQVRPRRRIDPHRRARETGMPVGLWRS